MLDKIIIPNLGKKAVIASVNPRPLQIEALAWCEKNLNI